MQPIGGVNLIDMVPNQPRRSLPHGVNASAALLSAAALLVDWRTVSTFKRYADEAAAAAEEEMAAMRESEREFRAGLTAASPPQRLLVAARDEKEEEEEAAVSAGAASMVAGKGSGSSEPLSSRFRRSLGASPSDSGSGVSSAPPSTAAAGGLTLGAGFGSGADIRVPLLRSDGRPVGSQGHHGVVVAPLSGSFSSGDLTASVVLPSATSPFAAGPSRAAAGAQTGAAPAPSAGAEGVAARGALTAALVGDAAALPRSSLSPAMRAWLAVNSRDDARSSGSGGDSSSGRNGEEGARATAGAALGWRQRRREWLRRRRALHFLVAPMANTGTRLRRSVCVRPCVFL